MNSTAVHSGWQDQPDGRGTFDILKSCGGTILLLCWSSVCPNVPSVRGGEIRKQTQKFYLFLLAILGPDFIFMTAVGQLQAAHDAQSKIKQAGLGAWTLRKCFFANMGGIHVRPVGWQSQSGKTSFAVNATQLLALVEKDLLKMPDIDEEVINDRNKTDTLARAITIVQVVWFTVQTFGRIGQGLAVTTLELTTLAFIFLMTATSICWWRKPMDISTPIILSLPIDLETVLSRLEISPEKSTQAYMGTPLSSIGRDEWFLSQVWFYYTELLRKFRLVPVPGTPYEFDYFGSIDFPKTSLKYELMAGPLILGYGAIFMAAWNFHFPTDIERILWHAAACVCLIFTVVGEGVAFLSQHWSSVSDDIQRRLPITSRSFIGSGSKQQERSQPSSMDVMCKKIHASMEWLRNVSPNRDPAMRLPLSILVPTTVLCTMYCFSRGYILAEDLASLRALPESAFETVDWGQYSPIL